MNVLQVRNLFHIFKKSFFLISFYVWLVMCPDIGIGHGQVSHSNLR